MDNLSRPPAVTLSVVMPCYNEAEHIEEILRAWNDTLQDQVDSFEILVVNDGSMDGTGRVLDRVRKEMPSLRVIHQLNGGRELACRRGLEAARGAWILQCDANGRHDPTDFAALWERRERPLVLGNPENVREGGRYRFLARVIRQLSRLLFGCLWESPQAPLRLWRRQALVRYLPRLPHAFAHVSLGLTLLLHRTEPEAIAEVGVPFRFRNGLRPPRSLFALFGAALHIFTDLVALRLSLIHLPTGFGWRPRS